MKILTFFILVASLFINSVYAFDTNLIQSVFNTTAAVRTSVPLENGQWSNDAIMFALNGKQAMIIGAGEPKIYDHSDQSFAPLKLDGYATRMLQNLLYAPLEDSILVFGPRSDIAMHLFYDGTYHNITGVPICYGQMSIASSGNDIFLTSGNGDVLIVYKATYDYKSGKDVPSSISFEKLTQTEFNAYSLCTTTRSDDYLVVYSNGYNVFGIRVDTHEVVNLYAPLPFYSNTSLFYSKSGLVIGSNSQSSFMVTTNSGQNGWDVSSAYISDVFSVVSLMANSYTQESNNGVLCVLTAALGYPTVDCYAGVPYYPVNYSGRGTEQLTKAELIIGIVLGSCALIIMTVIFALSDRGIIFKK